VLGDITYDKDGGIGGYSLDALHDPFQTPDKRPKSAMSRASPLYNHFNLLSSVGKHMHPDEIKNLE
jgi:hypothetical protein